MSIHKHWTCDIPAIAAAETDWTLASVREHSCEHNDRWRLTRAAKREILYQRRILQSIIHDDEAGTLRVRKRCTGDAIPCDDGRRRTRD